VSLFNIDIIIYTDGPALCKLKPDAIITEASESHSYIHIGENIMQMCMNLRLSSFFFNPNEMSYYYNSRYQQERNDALKEPGYWMMKYGCDGNE
jgi:hypothetical protein